MSFGRNPHVAKAEAAEQKARVAKDATACEQAWRDAARQWDRAADRESDDKRKTQYTARAEAARASADDPQVDHGNGGIGDDSAEEARKKLLN